MRRPEMVLTVRRVSERELAAERGGRRPWACGYCGTRNRWYRRRCRGCQR